MGDFKFRASYKFYPAEPIQYLDNDVYPELRFPLPNGQSGKRIFSNDLDCEVRPDQIDMSSDNRLPYFGKKITQDPIDYGTHALHPIEVIIDDAIVQEIAQFGREVCELEGERDILHFETAGFLAGQLNRDRHGRLWTHVQKSIHLDPPVIGQRDEVTIPRETQRIWSERIKDMGLERVGIWHTHPTYEPFQSDERFWGADVQATASNCQHWWSVSMVVDPYGIDYDRKQEKKDDVKRAVIGCYKMVEPGAHPDDLQDPLHMGWRSIAFGIRKEVADNASH